MGGTNGDDLLIGSIGDDTFWGDAGNDFIEGGFGNDQIRGGIGDDIITDIGGDDNIQGDDGNDVIHAGNGANLVLGGFGKDFIVTGEDASEAFGGPGDDFILGSDNNEQDMGNEGDDWLEGGLLDGSPGDNFDALGRDLIVGNDIYIGSGLADIMNAEGGDDIMVGSSGPGDKYLGASGFDWATFKDDPFGVSIDMTIRALDAGPVPAAAGILARFAAVEGLSGSAHNDFLQGDNADAITIPTAGLQGSVLTNIGLIDGLQEFLGAGVTSFGAGNIILGGDGSDMIEGRGGDDLIDGDLWLNVRISVRANNDGSGAEIDSYNSMVPLVPLMLAGVYNPGQLVAVREILPGNPGSGGVDTAVFAGPLQNYTILEDDNGTPDDPTDDVIIVTDNVGIEGTDRLTHIERLQFADQSIVLVPNLNEEPEGALIISDPTPTDGQLLTVSAQNVNDADGLGPLSFIWQFEPIPGTGIFQDIQTLTGVGVVRATGPSFTVTPDLIGLALRVRGIYQDANGTLESVAATPTAAVTETPNVTLSLAGVSVAEAGGAATVTATLSTAATQDVVINLAFGGTATPTEDFTPSANSILIPAGQVSGSITLTAVQDIVDESDETIVVSIDSTSNAKEVGTQQVEATIEDAHVSPQVLSSLVNGGEAQRSRVTNLVVTFSEAINVAGIQPGAFTITRHGGTAVENVLVNWSAGDTVATLTWSGTGTTGGSLNDGDYSLLIDHTKITDLALNALDGNAVTPDTQNYEFGAEQADSFFRLFGDINGNRIVNTIDYLAFRQAFGKSPSDPLFNSAFDYNGDGVVNTVDYLFFRQRFGVAFPFVP
jgi:Ca2+-binding RTX toxin-like protein